MRSPRSTPEEMIGKKFGHVTVTHFDYNSRGCRIWIGRCECGKQCQVRPYQVRAGVHISCGCARMGRRTHGLSKSPEFKVWMSMIQRCKYPNHHAFKDYGGRGIKVCARWEESFENFIADMGFRPNGKMSIDRADVNGNYCPENCRWADNSTQQNNRRNNHFLELGGFSMTIAEWERERGVCRGAIRMKILRGLSHLDAIMGPHVSMKVKT